MTVTYFEPIAPAYYENSTMLEVEYRGFKIRKQLELNLYSILVPEGKQIHRSLDGAFTRMELLKSNIDQFISDHGTYHAALTDIPGPKPRRGRPKKAKTPIEALLEPNNEDNN